VKLPDNINQHVSTVGSTQSVMNFRELLVVIACLFTALPATPQAIGSNMGKEEYEVVSIAFGKQTERVFMYGETVRHLLSALRDAVHSPVAPMTWQPPSDPALRRPRREPSEAVKKHMREEKARLEDEEAFRAQISDETINDWMEKNAISYEWEDQFDFDEPTVLISSEREKQQSSKDFWDGLRKKYPDLIAIDEASRVGFNRARTQAVVLVGYTTGPIGGEGEYVLLEKQNDHWSIVHRMRAWLS